MFENAWTYMWEEPWEANSARKYSTVMHVVGEVNNAFKILESALDGLFQTWRYIFSDEKQKDLFKQF